MGSIKPIGEGPNDPYENYRVEPIEERKEKGDFPKKPSRKKTFAAFVLKLFQKAVGRILERNSPESKTGGGSYSNVLLTKRLFAILKTEDRSQDVIFLNKLSKAWLGAMEESLQFNQEQQAKFREMIDEINSYPEDLPHTFGYYLKEYAGQKWVPFPYMELIQKIHHEHELSPENSMLSKWSEILSNLISLLNKNPP